MWNTAQILHNDCFIWNEILIPACQMEETLSAHQGDSSEFGHGSNRSTTDLARLAWQMLCWALGLGVRFNGAVWKPSRPGPNNESELAPCSCIGHSEPCLEPVRSAGETICAAGVCFTSLWALPVRREPLSDRVSEMSSRCLVRYTQRHTHTCIHYHRHKHTSNLMHRWCV